jgi:DNA-binding transcriptional MerR regulator
MGAIVQRNCGGWSIAALAALGSACAGHGTSEAASPARRTSVQAPAGADGSRCPAEVGAEREAVETVGTSSFKPSIRRVYRVVGAGEERRRILACREVDTNLDGIKDLVRLYDDHGRSTEERADANYDGVIDTWIRFAKGRVVQVEVDAAWDGQVDETRHYALGKLTRIERDTNQDGKTDIWEIYAQGHLDRMGVDLNHDGRVDRWNRDALVGSVAEGRGRKDPAVTSEDTELEP